MNATKIDWHRAGSDLPLFTWNPVTGCFHPCQRTYCYARRLAVSPRFNPGTPGWRDGLQKAYAVGDALDVGDGGAMHELLRPISGKHYPWDFDPTLHGYRLGEPAGRSRPARVFVVSMGDLFGEWVPERWIRRVLASCRRAPQHEYIFLTKNPARYLGVPTDEWPLSCYVGATVTTAAELAYPLSTLLTVQGSCAHDGHFVRTMLSLEPLRGPVSFDGRTRAVDWVIVGGMTGPDGGVPPREWIESIEADCARLGAVCTVKRNAVQA